MIKEIGNYGISTTEAIEVLDSLGHAIATWKFEEPQQKDNKNITNCRNCGAPVYGYKCEYCNTRY